MNDNDKLRALLRDRLQHFPNMPDGLRQSDHHMNVELSHQTDTFREIPDARPNECLGLQYSKNKMAAKVSVVIPFHKEPWSMIVRTINSVIFRTPVDILDEIILVDDQCPFQDIKSALKDYVAVLPIVRYIHTKTRAGIAGARLFGAKHARSSVIVFLDAHTECNIGWIGPLLEQLEIDPKVIAVPSIDHIDPQNLQYIPWTDSHAVRGSFNWKLEFVWKTMTLNELNKRKNMAENYPTDTVFGSAMAVNKNFFFKIGAIDDGMEYRDGDHIELSFRYWLCGNGIRVVPCSRVGHLFRHFIQYNIPGGYSTMMKNRQRVADIFLGEYTKLYYKLNPKLEISEKQLNTQRRRKLFFESLQCKSFDWYLRNIATDVELPPENAKYWGQFKNRHSQRCLTAVGFNKPAEIADCSYYSKNQTVTVDHEGHLKLGQMCLIQKPQSWHLWLEKCDENSPTWFFKTGNPTGLFPISVGGPKHISGRLQTTSDDEGDCVMHLTDPNAPNNHNQVVGTQRCQLMEKFQYWEFGFAIQN